MPTRKLISFDWAMKKLLRSKANFDILEGFLSELLKDDIHILEILESEGNKEDQRDKFNRVDLKVRNRKDELMISRPFIIKTTFLGFSRNTISLR